jgi:hypothetical protein
MSVVCGHNTGGLFGVSNYKLWYSSHCPVVSFNADGNTVDLAQLETNSSSCFTSGTAFNILVNPMAATHGSLAPFNLVYDPQAVSGTLVVSGRTDSRM